MRIYVNAESKKKKELEINEICYKNKFSILEELNYINNHTKIHLKCNVCETNFYPSYSTLKKGSGCPKCNLGKKKKYTKETCCKKAKEYTTRKELREKENSVYITTITNKLYDCFKHMKQIGNRY